MKSKVKAFLDMYDKKMPANGVPFELKQRLVFSEVSAEKAAQSRRPWMIMLNTYIVAATLLISAFTFWQLGEDVLFIWSIPPVQQQEVIPSEMVTYLEDNTDAYLDWAIFSKEYLGETTLKFYVGKNNEDFYFFYYLTTTDAVFLQIECDEDQFLFSGLFDSVSMGKTLIEARSNVTITISLLNDGEEVHDEYVFRIPQYLEIFTA